MINFVKVLSSEIESGSLKRRIIKVLRLGRQDVQTPYSASSYGIDSNPVKDMIGVYLETGEKGKTVLVGYVNKNMLAAEGETRLFSTDANGVLKAFAWLKNDGTIEFNGNANNLVRYTALNAGLQDEANKINVELGKISAVLNTIIPGSYTVVPVTIDVSSAKIDELKTT